MHPTPPPNFAQIWWGQIWATVRGCGTKNKQAKWGGAPWPAARLAAHGGWGPLHAQVCQPMASVLNFTTGKAPNLKPPSQRPQQL